MTRAKYILLGILFLVASKSFAENQLGDFENIADPVKRQEARNQRIAELAKDLTHHNEMQGILVRIGIAYDTLQREHKSYAERCKAVEQVDKARSEFKDLLGKYSKSTREEFEQPMPYYEDRPATPNDKIEAQFDALFNIINKFCNESYKIVAQPPNDVYRRFHHLKSSLRSGVNELRGSYEILKNNAARDLATQSKASDSEQKQISATSTATSGSVKKSESKSKVTK